MESVAQLEKGKKKPGLRLKLLRNSFLSFLYILAVFCITSRRTFYSEIECERVETGELWGDFSWPWTKRKCWTAVDMSCGRRNFRYKRRVELIPMSWVILKLKWVVFSCCIGRWVARATPKLKQEQAIKSFAELLSTHFWFDSLIFYCFLILFGCCWHFIVL